MTSSNVAPDSCNGQLCITVLVLSRNLVDLRLRRNQDAPLSYRLKPSEDGRTYARLLTLRSSRPLSARSWCGLRASPWSVSVSRASSSAALPVNMALCFRSQILQATRSPRGDESLVRFFSRTR